jgi:hypothetical protein
MFEVIVAVLMNIRVFGDVKPLDPEDEGASFVREVPIDKP